MTPKQQRNPSLSLACSLWLADHRQNNFRGVLSHAPAEAKRLANTEPYIKTLSFSTHLGISAFTSPQFPYLSSPLSTQFLAAILAVTILFSMLLLLLVSHYFCFTAVPIFAFSKLFPSLSSFAVAPDPVFHNSPFHSLSSHTLFFCTMFSTIQYTIQTVCLLLPLKTGTLPYKIHVRISEKENEP